MSMDMDYIVSEYIVFILKMVGIIIAVSLIVIFIVWRVGNGNTWIIN